MPKKSSIAPNRRHERTINKRTSDDLLTELPGKLQRVGIAADHGGYELKEYLGGKLRQAGHEVIDSAIAVRKRTMTTRILLCLWRARLLVGRWSAALESAEAVSGLRS